ncbi:MAG: spore coat protein CotJB [Christensenellaceae bacterium]|nr:spore coat protein CotJB [Christensenellaceae bacterium]
MAFVLNWPCPVPCTPAEEASLPAAASAVPAAAAAPVVVQAATAEQTDAMVTVVPQVLTQIIQPAQALPLGTLYPELNKPLTSTSSPVTARPTQKQIYSFAAWEMRLYLDTHPTDTIALALYQQMAAQAGEPNYASTFATSTATGRWTWLDDPWPWEYGASSAGTTTAEV